MTEQQIYDIIQLYCGNSPLIYQAVDQIFSLHEKDISEIEKRLRKDSDDKNDEIHDLNESLNRYKDLEKCDRYGHIWKIWKGYINSQDQNCKYCTRCGKEEYF